MWQLRRSSTSCWMLLARRSQHPEMGAPAQNLNQRLHESPEHAVCSCRAFTLTGNRLMTVSIVMYPCRKFHESSKQWVQVATAMYLPGSLIIQRIACTEGTTSSQQPACICRLPACAGSAQPCPEPLWTAWRAEATNMLRLQYSISVKAECGCGTPVCCKNELQPDKSQCL